jgi:DNA-directed RNA polymerase specialized sigma24 family protein
MSTAARQFFDEMLRHQYGRLANAAFGVTRRMQPADRQDAFASALLAAYEQAGDFDPERGGLASWFVGLVKNERRKFFRRELHPSRHLTLWLQL